MNNREYIAKRVAKEFKEGMVVNLGFGMPTTSANYIPEGTDVILQSENGVLRFGGKPSIEELNQDNGNAGGQPITLLNGASVFDLATSFAIIRGGHVDMTVLGAFQVDEEGDIANWQVPGKFMPGMGGAMDLVIGAKKVIVAMEHTDKNGDSKILKKCNLPLTGKSCVDLIITERCVMEVNKEGLILKEIAPGYTLEQIVESTEANFKIADDLNEKMNN